MLKKLPEYPGFRTIPVLQVSNMYINYYKWMALKVTNNYFLNGVCPYLEMLPLRNTVHQIKNYQILIRKESNMFSFYSGVSAETETFSLSDSFNGITDLFFQLVSVDPLFFNYTDILPVSDNQFYYFENSINPDNLQVMQRSKFVSGKDIVSCKPKIFNIIMPDKKVSLEIKQNDGLIIKSEIIDGNIIRNLLLNLSGFDDGIYMLWLDNELQETFFMTNENIVENCIGILRLNMKEIISQNQDNLEFSIDFNARSVFLQYLIVVQKSRKINITEMSVSGTGDDKYEGPVDQEIPGGQQAQVFTSPNPVLMQNQPEKTPQLKVTYSNDFSGRKKQLEIKLPDPGAEQIEKYNHGKNEGSFFSTTIFYV